MRREGERQPNVLFPISHIALPDGRGRNDWTLGFADGQTVVSRTLPTGRWTVMVRGCTEPTVEAILFSFGVRACRKSGGQFEELQPAHERGSNGDRFGSICTGPALASFERSLHFGLHAQAEVQIFVHCQRGSVMLQGVDAEFLQTAQLA